jgi:hypothetical protein
MVRATATLIELTVASRLGACRRRHLTWVPVWRARAPTTAPVIQKARSELPSLRNSIRVTTRATSTRAGRLRSRFRLERSTRTRPPMRCSIPCREQPATRRGAEEPVSSSRISAQDIGRGADDRWHTGNRNRLVSGRLANPGPLQRSTIRGSEAATIRQTSWWPVPAPLIASRLRSARPRGERELSP